PIIMLTARDSDVDFITAFNLGTDDYFTKPFSPIKLSLHVKALFKRLDEKAIKNDTQYQFLDLTLDTEKRIALLSNEEMPLTKTEFDFLLVLIEKPETAFSRETLLNRIWGFDDIESRAVDDTIKRLRKKFKQYHSQVSIKTVWGYGFKLIKEDK
ncbi:TPA: response regulator transcription factor, partial [Streptococcus agalactiae]